MLFAGDCSNGIDGSKFAADGGTDDSFIDTDLTDPAAVIEAYERAWNEQNYEALEALLDDDFEFCPTNEDAGDFPWMEENCWPRTLELGMAFNMFNDDFTGGEQPVDLIEISLTVQDTKANDAGNIEVACVSTGRIMWNATDGKSFDTRLIFELVSREGFLRIRKILEIPRTGRNTDGGFGHSTWGRIKSMFRPPLDGGLP